TAEELRLHGRKAITDESDPELSAALWGRHQTGEFRGELSLKGKDGTGIPVELSSRTFRDSQGNRRAISIVRDISDRKLAELALRRSQRDLEVRNRIAEILLVGSERNVYGDLLKVILDTLQSPCGIFGYVDKEVAMVCASMAEEVWRYCQVPHDETVFHHEKWKAIWNDALKQGKTISADGPSKSPDGHPSMFSSIVAPIIHQGALIGVIQAADKETGYDKDDENLMNSIANFIAPVLRSRLRSEREERARIGAEHALHESEEMNRLLSDVTYEAIGIHDEGVLLHANSQYFEMFGYEPHELLGKQAVPRTLAPESIASVRQRIGNESKVRYEAIGLKKDGTRFPIEVQARICTFQGKKVRAAAIRDITDRKQAEEALRESEERYRTLFESAGDGIFIMEAEGDRAGTIVTANPAAAGMRGYDVEELIGKRITDLVVPESAKGTAERFRRILRGEWASAEVINIRKDGTRFPTEISAGLLEFGSRKYILGFHRDITDRKRSEDELLETRRLIQLLLDRMPYAAMLLRPYTREIVASNAAAAQVGAVPGKKCFSTWGRHDAPCPWCLGPDMWETGEAQQIEVETAGTVMENHWIPIERDLYMHYAVDITEFRLAERKIKTSLKEKEVLLREIHHRVKNNLAVISSLLGLQSRHAHDDRHRQMFEDSRERIRSMALAHELLYQSEDLGNLNLGRYVGNLVDHLILSAGSVGISISVKKDIQEVSFGLDTAIPLGFILTELVSNCVKHAFPDRRDGRIEIALRSLGGAGFELLVSDDGVGIPEHVDKENPKSLGLVLVNTFTRQLEGKLEIDGTAGTKVRVAFEEAK
ncbi:PAS domain S-box protein, partial [Thermodesulfobacteriota bacterium]